jgi:hypothetical protein
LGEPVGLLLASGLHLFFDGGTNGRKTIAQPVSDLQAYRAFGLFQAHGGVGCSRGKLCRKSLMESYGSLCKLR